MGYELGAIVPLIPSTLPSINQKAATPGRLSDAEVVRMTAEQNRRIADLERRLSRKLYNDEKLQVIAQVQREFGVKNVGPGNQAYDPKTGSGTFTLDSVLNQVQQTPVNIANETGKNWVRTIAPVATWPIKQLYDFSTGQTQAWGDVVKSGASRVAKDAAESLKNPIVLIGLGAAALYLFSRSRR